MLAVSAAVAVAGCGGPGPHDIVAPRKVARASGSPTIKKLVDLGDLGRLPVAGPMPALDSDGVFAVGELILIEGENFGKQPAVTVGERPARLVARTGSGGIITRIPPGVRTGARKVEVSNKKGKNAQVIEVARYGFVVHPAAGKVYVLALGQRGEVEPRGVIEIPGARDIALSADGQVALVASEAAGTHETARLSLIAVTASGGPRLVHELRITGTRADRIASAARGDLAAISTGRQVILVDLRDPRHPAAYRPFDLGLEGDASITSLALSPEADTLAVLSASGNRLIPVDVSRPGSPRRGQPLGLLPDELVPLARDLGFAPEQQRMYVVTGDSPGALAAGTHPTVILELGRDGGSWAVTRKAELDGPGAPTAVAVSPIKPQASGTAVQAGDAHVPVAVTAIDRGYLVEHGAADSPSVIVSAALAGTSDTLATDRAAILDIAISYDGRLSVASAVRTNGEDTELGVLVTSMSGGKPTFVRLDSGASAHGIPHIGVALSP